MYQVPIDACKYILWEEKQDAKPSGQIVANRDKKIKENNNAEEVKVKEGGPTVEKIFISSKEAAQLLGICVTKVQELCRSRYKGFPGMLDGNKYRINASLLPEWAKRVTEEGGFDA